MALFLCATYTGHACGQRLPGRSCTGHCKGPAVCNDPKPMQTQRHPWKTDPLYATRHQRHTYDNADDRNRTYTGVSPQAPEACASASSATSAGTDHYYHQAATGRQAFFLRSKSWSASTLCRLQLTRQGSGDMLYIWQIEGILDGLPHSSGSGSPRRRRKRGCVGKGRLVHMQPAGDSRRSHGFSICTVAM